VPAFPAGDVMPADAFDASGSVIADLTRIAIKLKIAPISKMAVSAEDVSTDDVYAQVVRLNNATQLLLK